MCLILFAWQPDDEYQLIVAANRDEFYSRPSQQASFWPGLNLLAGKDLQAGGTWLGTTTSGRFAAVTNFREEPPHPIPPRTRGELTTDFLRTDFSAEDYLATVRLHSQQYRGFNLLLASDDELQYYSNRIPEARVLQPGTYGLSNQLLDCDWSKVCDGRAQLSTLISGGIRRKDLFDLLHQSGTDQPWSDKFIATREYGTCASTIFLLTRSGEALFEERVFGSGGHYLASSSFRFTVPPRKHRAVDG